MPRDAVPAAPSEDPRLEEGIQTFNEGRHWHAHEAWEGLWLESHGDDRTFIQGLIMAAALLVHYGRGNPVGVLKHWKNVQERLPRFAPTRWGVQVQDLLDQLARYVETARTGRLGLDPARVQIQRPKDNAT